MTSYQGEERSYGGYSSHARPSGSSHGTYGQGPSPERLHSSQGYVKGELMPPQSPYQSHEQAPPGSSHGHSSYPPQPPITPVSGSSYPPQPPSGGYYGLSTPSTDQQQMPSPPLSNGERPESQNFTPDGVPIVPVGVSGGKMFRCRGYGECDKVFTRSEHLARHVRKHTGERPFPCHCGKAFSRLDNLRQHSATVHADQAALNEAMLNSLAQVHSALSQKANKEQRRRGEIVEVPKNAVERPRHNEQYRSKSQQGGHPGGGSPYDSPYPHHEHQFTVPPPPQGRPRAGSNYDHPPYDGPAPLPHGDEPGPSRRPSSSGYANYPPMYHDQPGTRPPTGGSVAPSEMSHLPYPYRPMSSSGRELPVPAHYAESEPPSSAHGPPQSPMYPPNIHSAPPTWSSSPPPPQGGYASQSGPYPPPDGYAYPPASEHSYGPPPSGSNGNYAYPPAPPQSYYPPPSGYSSVPPPHTHTSGSYPPPPPAFGASGPPTPIGPPPPSPFSYHAPSESYYTHSQYDSRKRRSDDMDHLPRKAPRPSAESVSSLSEMQNSRPMAQEPLWLPPSSERRSSLAISALLGSPQQVPRSRPTTADIPAQPAYQASPAGFAYSAADSSNGSQSMPATPAINGDRKPDIKGEGGFPGMGNMGGVGENMEQKAKALLSQGR